MNNKDIQMGETKFYDLSEKQKMIIITANL